MYDNTRKSMTKLGLNHKYFLTVDKKCPDALHCFNAQNTTRYCSNDQ